MGSTTPIWQLPYPAESDPADVPVDIKALADRMEAILISLSAVPTGTIVQYGSATAPSSWVLCDGSSLLRAGTYAALFAVIGTTYGAADGTHFNVPDLRGRIPVGLAASGHADVSALANNEGSTLANRRPKHPHTNGLTFAGTNANTGTVSVDHQHYVSGNTGGRSAGHVHGSGLLRTSGGNWGSTAYGNVDPGNTDGENVDHTHGVGIWSGGISANHTHNITPAGSIGGSIGAAGVANDAPAYIVVNYIIKI